jgi:hypothetical protein
VFTDILHNQSADLIKKALLERRRTMGFQRIIIDVPYHLKSSIPEPNHHINSKRYPEEEHPHG